MGELIFNSDISYIANIVPTFAAEPPQVCSTALIFRILLDKARGELAPLVDSFIGLVISLVRSLLLERSYMSVFVSL
ncbi:MAG: hypothetical protein WA947_03090 [Phormidesmis sp.]